AEADAGLAHSLALLADPPQHLVFDLDQIVGVVEGVGAGKGGIADRLGSGVEGVVTAKGGNLVGWGVGRCQGRPPVWGLGTLCRFYRGSKAPDVGESDRACISLGRQRAQQGELMLSSDKAKSA